MLSIRLISDPQEGQPVFLHVAAALLLEYESRRRQGLLNPRLGSHTTSLLLVKLVSERAQIQEMEKYITLFDKQMTNSHCLSNKASIKIPKILELENFQVGESVEIGESGENIEVLPSSHKSCPMCLFHLVVPEVYPFTIKH